jgi:hypothetical protein
MMGNFLKKWIILFSLIFSHQAFSRWFADIHAGFGFTPETDDNDDEIIFNGVETGIRFGLGHRILIFGVDTSYGWTQSEWSYLSTTERYDMKKFDLGAFVGIDAGKLVRFWISYFPESEWSIEAAGSPKLDCTAVGGGAGLTILPYVTFNLEAKFYNMNKFTISGTTTTWTGEQKMDPYEVIVTLGFVF